MSDQDSFVRNVSYGTARGIVEGIFNSLRRRKRQAEFSIEYLRIEKVQSSNTDYHLFFRINNLGDGNIVAFGMTGEYFHYCKAGRNTHSLSRVPNVGIDIPKSTSSEIAMLIDIFSPVSGRSISADQQTEMVTNGYFRDHDAIELKIEFKYNKKYIIRRGYFIWQQTSRKFLFLRLEEEKKE